MFKNKVEELIQQKQPIKLHLGCGPIKLPDYLNIVLMILKS